MQKTKEFSFLSYLFGSPFRARFFTFLFRNDGKLFETKEMALKLRESLQRVQKELHLLRRLGIVKEKAIFVNEEGGEKQYSLKRKSGKRKKVYFLDHAFPFFSDLSILVNKTLPKEQTFLVERLQPLGKIRLLITSGIFHGAKKGGERCDLLIVGDDLKKHRTEEIMSKIENSIGQEIAYTVMSSEEFLYRHDIYDKFIRDILDYPHDKLINKLNI